MEPSVAILLAAGRGSRMGPAVADKILERVADRPVFVHSVNAFVAAEIVDRLVVVFRDARQRVQLEALLAKSRARNLPVAWMRGGRERQDSVARGLRAARGAGEPVFVFIHDCARPLVRPEILRRVAAAVRRDGAACLARRVTDTIKRAPGGPTTGRRLRLTTVDRKCLWAMETPQAFRWDVIAPAYEKIAQRKVRITDDASAVELTSRHRVTLIESTFPNPKLTQPADLTIVASLLRLR